MLVREDEILFHFIKKQHVLLLARLLNCWEFEKPYVVLLMVFLFFHDTFQVQEEQNVCKKVIQGNTAWFPLK